MERAVPTVEGYRKLLEKRRVESENSGLIPKTTGPPQESEHPGSIPDPESEASVCPRCHGAGFLRLRVEDVYSPDFGKIVQCTACAPTPAEKLKERLTYAKLPPGLARMTFDSLDIQKQPALAPVVAHARRYAQGKAEEPWLVLAGTPGWAKTHIAAAILNERALHPEWGPPGLYASCPRMLDDLRQGYSDDSYLARLQEYQNVPLLLLDDVGAERHKGEYDWADEQLYKLLNERYINCRPTIITTNISPESMPPRLADRLMDSNTRLVKVFGLDVPSYRTGRRW